MASCEVKLKRGVKPRDLAGQVFGLLTVIELDRRDERSRAFWQCQCECGKLNVVRGDFLRAKRVISCGCEGRRRVSAAAKRHGQAWPKRSSEYAIWIAMRQRCGNESCKAYPNYGGRGISVCERWMKFEDFFADMGTRPSQGHSIERIDNNGNYEPSNCCWATMAQQAKNKRPKKQRKTVKQVSHNGESLTISEWANRLGVTPECLRMRLHCWPIERALTAQ